MRDSSDLDTDSGPARSPTGVLRLAWLSTILPFVVCLPLRGILEHAPQATFVELDRLELGYDIDGLWQITGPSGDRLVLSGSDRRLHLLDRTSGQLQDHPLDLPLDVLGEGLVAGTVTDYDGDGLDDLIVQHQPTMDEYGEEADSPTPSVQSYAVYLQRDGRLVYHATGHELRLDITMPPYGVICNRWLSYGTRPKFEDTLLVPTTRGAAGRLLKGQILAAAELNGDARDAILTAVTNPAEPQAELVLYQADRRGYRTTWNHRVDVIKPEVDDANPQPLAALADLDDDWRAELVLCQRSPGVVNCYAETGPKTR